MQHQNLTDHPNHAIHDATLVAGHAAGDLTDSERARAQALLDTCPPCADLHRDLVAIAAATRALPNLATAPRDFRLDAEQAARLSRGSWLRAALRPFASARSATRPMAAAFTSLGIAGLLVVTIMPGLFGSAASTGAQRERTSAGAPTTTFGPAAAPGGSVAGLGDGATAAPVFAAGSARPDEVDPNDSKVDAQSTDGGEEVVAGGVESPAADLESTEGPRAVGTTQANPVLIGSLGLLGIGILLFGLRFAARRIR
jgi:anti-sigma factor RsiW